MPYDIRKSSDGYHVINQKTGEDKGVSKTRAKAEAHMKHLISAEPSRASTSPGTMANPKGDMAMALNDSYRPEPIAHAYRGGRMMAPGLGRRPLPPGPLPPGPQAPAPQMSIPPSETMKPREWPLMPTQSSPEQNSRYEALKARANQADPAAAMRSAWSAYHPGQTLPGSAPRGFKAGGKFKLFEKGDKKGDTGPESKAEDAPEKAKSGKSMPPWMKKFAKKKK